MTRLRVAVVVCAAMALLAGCGNGNGAAGDGGEHDHGGGGSDIAENARRVEVVADSFSFAPDRIEAEVGEDLAIVLDNVDNLPHDFKIDALDVHVDADPRETGRGGLRADEAGTYAYYCSIAGHRSSGMEGTLVVS